MASAVAPTRRRRSWLMVSDMANSSGSARLVGVEDVVLALHCDMAGVPAVGWRVFVGRPLGGRGVVVEERVSPTAGLRKSLAVLLDDESLREDVRHIDVESGFRALLWLPLQLDDLGPFRERLAVPGNAGLVGLDHRRIGDDDLEHFIGAGGGDHRPVLVAFEVGEGDSARRFQRVLVGDLRVNGRAQGGEHCRRRSDLQDVVALHGCSLDVTEGCLSARWRYSPPGFVALISFHIRAKMDSTHAKHSYMVGECHSKRYCMPPQCGKDAPLRSRASSNVRGGRAAGWFILFLSVIARFPSGTRQVRPG